MISTTKMIGFLALGTANGIQIRMEGSIDELLAFASNECLSLDTIMVRVKNQEGEQKLEIKNNVPLYDALKCANMDRAYSVWLVDEEVDADATAVDLDLEDGAILNCIWKDGAGSITFPSGSRYDGEWQDGKKHGRGEYTYASGDKYDGEWQDDRKHGRGVYTWADGDVYEGEWQDGKKHGLGAYTYANGDVYEGEWQDGEEHGRGTVTYASGARYDGEWQDGKKHGRGTYTYSNGDRYDGEWRDGKEHGRGIYTYANGYRYQGEYDNGRVVREVRLR